VKKIALPKDKMKHIERIVIRTRREDEVGGRARVIQVMSSE